MEGVRNFIDAERADVQLFGRGSRETIKFGGKRVKSKLTMKSIRE